MNDLVSVYSQTEGGIRRADLPLMVRLVSKKKAADLAALE
jgi:hypothetical protein